MTHAPEPYVKYFKLLKRILPRHRVQYDFHLKMDGGWVRMKDEDRKPVFTGVKAKLKINGKDVGYATDVKFDVDLSKHKIEVIDEF